MGVKIFSVSLAGGCCLPREEMRAALSSCLGVVAMGVEEEAARARGDLAGEGSTLGFFGEGSAALAGEEA